MTGTRFPEKIAILYNRGTASAGEGLIAYAIQSSKVLTLGEHSGGYIGYGNVMTHETPCNKFIIHSTTTKYNNLSKYEFAGIPPMVPLNGKPDWIKEAVLLLKK